MIFRKSRTRIAPDTTAQGVCCLTANTWDDFGFKTLFEAVLFDPNGKRFDLGFVRIMRFGMTGGFVQLPDEFERLDAQFCSLGNNRDYYVSVAEVDPETRATYLASIRDCASDHTLWEAFKSQQGMRSSLLRDSSPVDVLQNYPRILRGEAELTSYTFSFHFDETEGGEEKQCDFAVRPNSKPPSNIHVLIGRNGVGKTRLLAGMGDALTENNAASIGLTGRFEFTQEGREQSEFLNLVIVSFSAFDRFDPIPSGSARTEHSLPYYYVGIKKPFAPAAGAAPGGESGVAIKSPEEIDTEFREAIQTVASDRQRLDRWTAAVRILSSDPGIAEADFERLLVEEPATACDDIASAFSEMSSGHKIVLLTITKLIEYISDRSLVLMDEPEVHLHPPLLGSFVRALSGLLISRNGVAILATHSPVVLQEVPANCVSILLRSGDSLRVTRPDVETFAENVSVLTRKVFGLEVDQSGFYKLLRDSAEGRSFESVMEQFGDGIGGEGRALTRAFTVDRG